MTDAANRAQSGVLMNMENVMMGIRNQLLGLSRLVVVGGCTPFNRRQGATHNGTRRGVSQSGVDNAMRACGYINFDGVGDTSPIDVVLTLFYCMKEAGFKRRDNLDLCKEGRIGESPVCEGRQ